MKPEPRLSGRRIPTFSGRAHDLSIRASIETVESYHDNLEKYQENNYRYIPLPKSDQYYDQEDGSLHGIASVQYIDGSESVKEVFELLTENPFLLEDEAASLEVYVVSEDEFYLLSEDAPDHARVKDADEIEDEYPGIADQLTHVSEGRYRIITIADLNRRIVGEQLYPFIAELESSIAEVIEDDVNDPKKMYYNVSEKIIGRREKDILEDIEMHTAEYLSLGDMIGFLKGREHLLDEFGFESPSDCGSRLSSIQDLRNRVMHSNRTLIRSREDIQKTLERVEDIEEILSISK